MPVKQFPLWTSISRIFNRKLHKGREKTCKECDQPSRITVPDPNSGDPSLLPIYKEIHEAMGRVPDLFKTLAGYPNGLRSLFDVYKAIYHQSTIERRLQEIALIRASVKNGSVYCLHLHMDFGFQAGLTHKQIDALRYHPDGGEFTEKEQVVIEYADWVTREPSSVSDELFSRLKHHFTESQIINLTLIISQINSFSRYADALRLHSEH